MSKLLELTQEQQKAYDRFIRARNKMGIGRGVISQYRSKSKPKWIPSSDCLACIDVAGMNHPMFILNEDYQEYKEAFEAWLDVEPKFRDQERMRASRGDYGASDNWEERKVKIKDSATKLEE
jgi:hypothetical protein